eukprot:c15614_g1_i1 orf=59-322(+)
MQRSPSLGALILRTCFLLNIMAFKLVSGDSNASVYLGMALGRGIPLVRGFGLRWSTCAVEWPDLGVCHGGLIYQNIGYTCVWASGLS